MLRRFGWIFILLLGGFWIGSPGFTLDETSNSFLLYNPARLTEVKESLRAGKTSPYIKSGEAILRWADGAVKQPLLSITEKTIPPPSGDKHDYRSLSIYYWPDPSKPGGLPYINKDGLVNPEIKDTAKFDEARISRLTYNLEILSLAYYLSGKEVYAEKAVAFLHTWFIDPKTRMNPNLNYAQGVPGKNEGQSSGIIDTVSVIKIVEAARILESSPAFSSGDQRALKDWFRKYIKWLENSDPGMREARATNNHGVWYAAQVTSFAWYTGDTKLIAKIAAEAKVKLIAPQIEPDGSMPRELARTRSLHYTTYNLSALINLARTAETAGVNLWDFQTADGRGIRQAIDYVIPYLVKKKTWEHQMIVNDSEAGFSKYLILAYDHYQKPEYLEAVKFLLGEGTPVREKIACAIP